MTDSLILLQEMMNKGILDIATVKAVAEQMNRQEILSRHQYRIWEHNGIWYTYIPDMQKKRRLITRTSQKALEDYLILLYQQKITLTDVFNEWIEEKLAYGEILKQTYDRYRTDYAKYLADTDIADMDMSKITEDILERYIKTTIHACGLTAKAWGNLRTLLRGSFRLAKKKGITSIVIGSFIDELGLSPKAFTKHMHWDSEQVFTDAERRSIEAYVSSHPTDLGLGVLLAFETGLRCGELSALKWSDVRGDLLYVTKTEIRYKDADGYYVWEIRDSTKGRDGGRRVILTDKAISLLQQIRRLNPFGEWLFMRNDKRIKGQAFSRRLKAICKSVGIPERSIHKARKTYATNLLNAGVDEKLIEKQMGHTTIATTRGYYYFDNHELAEAKDMINRAIKKPNHWGD